MADQAPPELHLPPSIAAAWGLAGRLAKGPRPALNLDKIVSAAIAVADAEGLDALSMSRVAGQLGTATMSLYRYIAAKGELLDLMQDAAYGPPPEVPDGQLDWRTHRGVSTPRHQIDAVRLVRLTNRRARACGQHER